MQRRVVCGSWGKDKTGSRENLGRRRLEDGLMEQKGGGKLEFGPWSEAPVYVGIVSKKEGLEGQGNVEGETLVERQRERSKERGAKREGQRGRGKLGKKGHSMLERVCNQAPLRPRWIVDEGDDR